MSQMLPGGSVLFDKGVIRRIYERRVRLALGQTPTLLQVQAANAYSPLASFGCRLCVIQQTANILLLRPQIFAAAILADVHVLEKGLYLRRWARYNEVFSEIQRRFNDMVFRLPPPYSGAGLPRILTTATILTLG